MLHHVVALSVRYFVIFPLKTLLSHLSVPRSCCEPPLYIYSCHQLPFARTGGSTKPDPVVQLSVSSRPEVQETRTVRWSRSPVYEEGFVCLVNNPELDQLTLKVSAVAIWF